MSQDNYCSGFVEILPKLFRNRKVAGLSSEEIEDIVSQTVVGVFKYFDKFLREGGTRERLGHLVQMIFNRRADDYYRSLYSTKSVSQAPKETQERSENTHNGKDDSPECDESEQRGVPASSRVYHEDYDELCQEVPAEDADPADKIHFQEILEILKKMAYGENLKCAKFLIDYYQLCLDNDLSSDKDCAKTLGLLPNTFTITKKRCSKTVSDKLSKRGVRE